MFSKNLSVLQFATAFAKHVLIETIQDEDLQAWRAYIKVKILYSAICCMSNNCSKPEGKNIKWIECRCNRWFHTKCSKRKKSDASVFLCIFCKFE